MDNRSKTNVMRIVEAQGVSYRSMSYEVEEGQYDGNLVARNCILIRTVCSRHLYAWMTKADILCAVSR